MRKGFAYTVEAIVAALLILAYLSSFAFPTQQNNDWSANILRQQGTEYLESIDRANLSRVFFEKNYSSFDRINRYFFPGSRLSASSDDVPKRILLVGVISNYSNDPVITFNAAPTPVAICNAQGWITEYDCILNSTNTAGVPVILTDWDAGAPDGSLNYDSLYFDFDGDGEHDADEGPYAKNTVALIGTENYSIGNINSQLKSAALWNASWARQFSAIFPPNTLNINGRDINVIFFAASPDSDISAFDALVISSAMDISAYDMQLIAYLRSGGGIVEAAEITEGNLGTAQKQLFGIDKVDYSIIPGSGMISLDSGAAPSDPIGVKDYFAGIPIRLSANLPSGGYDISRLPDPPSVRLGMLVTSRGSVPFAVSKSSGAYNAIHFDTNDDGNFSNPYSDETGYLAGDYFNASSNTYVVRRIMADGSYAEVRPMDTHIFTGAANPLNIYTYAKGSVVAFQDSFYSISDNSLYSIFEIFMDLPERGDTNTLPSGQHKYGAINYANSKIHKEFNFSVTASDANYTLLNIDLNDDTLYNGLGEGPFLTGEKVTIGPEDYKITILPDGSKVFFELKSRHNVPYSIANRAYGGRTLWMPPISGESRDMSGLLEAAILWVSNKNTEAGYARYSESVVSVGRTMISSGDMYYPYNLDIAIGYWS